MEKLKKFFWSDRKWFGKTITILFGLGIANTIAMEVVQPITDPDGYAKRKQQLEIDRQDRIHKKVEDETLEKQKDKLAKAESQLRIERGFHCLSAWNGSHGKTIDILKKSLRDPDSFDHIETKIGAQINGAHRLTMSYRARNGFGGLDIGRIEAQIDNSSCNVIDIKQL